MVDGRGPSEAGPSAPPTAGKRVAKHWLTQVGSVLARLGIEHIPAYSLQARGEECLRFALRAPTGGNRRRWHFVVVTNPVKRRAIADLYRKRQSPTSSSHRVR
jgi:hypothetical protein